MVLDYRLLLFKVLILISQVLVPVNGIPVIGNVTASAEELGGKKSPIPSYLLDASQKTENSLLDPTQLMSSRAECQAFTNGTSPKEFSSPNYPNNYPHNIDCIKIIEAPEGHVVLVQFQDVFHIEQGDPSMSCPYDYLETREGKFGYSPEQAKICGKQPPTLTQSSGQYLWLRFHSDSTVAYQGFRAVIQFPDTTPKPDFDNCTFEIDGIEGDIVSKTSIPDDYLRRAQTKKDSVDCTWVIRAPLGHKIFLQLPVYNLEKPNSCIHNAIEIYTSYAKLAGRTTDPPIKLCGSLQKSTVTSEDHVLAIRLTTKVGPKSLDDDKKKLSHFQANYTIFRSINESTTPTDGKTSGVDGSRCEADEFACSDNTCIPIILKCNKNVNCQLKDDEDNCPDLKPEGLKADLFVIAFIGALLVVGMCTGMFLNIFRKLKQDREEIRELRALTRKSRESGMGSEVQSQKSACPSENLQQNHQIQASRPVQNSIEEQSSSTESKDTVIHKPFVTIESTKRNHAESSVPAALEAAITTGPVAPPPPTPPILQLNQQRKLLSRRASDVPIVPKANLQVAVYRKPSEPIPEYKGPPSSVLVPMQFVRDCACQTRESYLMARRFSMLRAPLARAEAIEFFQGTPVRRLSRPSTPTTYFPPSSASSEIGNSLERLDEEFE